MADPSLTERLLECFRAVFPGVSDEELVHASATSLAKWDSVAHVTLISLIEEELGLQFPLERYADLTSFSALRDETTRGLCR
jgi:acyl carrier protein